MQIRESNKIKMHSHGKKEVSSTNTAGNHNIKIV